MTTRGVRLQLGSTVRDPIDPVGRLLFNVLAMVAEFESDLIKARTHERLGVARAAVATVLAALSPMDGLRMRR